MKSLARLLLAALTLALLAACGGAPAPQPTAAPTAAPAAPQPTAAPTAAPAAQALKIVASTSWVGAFAKAAGATDISVIAPSNLQHPPDYDPKPADLAALSGADYVLMAGFEGFAPRMQEAVGGDSSKLITVQTENSPEAIRAEVTRLGELFGTQEAAATFLSSFDAEYARLSAEVKAALGDAQPVVVAQAFVTPWVVFAGLEPVGTYGPAPMTPAELQTLAGLAPAVVFENVHMGGGQPLIEATGAKELDLVNFPGADLDLLAVFAANTELLIEELSGGVAAPAPRTPAITGEAVPFDVRVAQYYLDTAGFHDMAETISATQKLESSYLTTVSRVARVLKQTTWPADLDEPATTFLTSLDALAAALTAEDVAAATTASEAVHDTQHELSHEVDHWLEGAAAPAGEADVFRVSLAQYLLDTAGFHDMAETISATQELDSAYLTTVSRTGKVFHSTAWPADASEQATAFLTSLDALAAALTAEDVAAATTASEAVHDTQHELSHALDHWLEEGQEPAAEADLFQVRVAQYLLDTAGFHDMAETISATQELDSAYLTTVSRTGKVFRSVTWPADAGEQATAFLTSLDALAAALTAEDVAAATTAANAVHDTQHELSHAVDHAADGGGGGDHGHDG